MAHPFAFRLHQFISRGDTVHASLEPEEHRHITVHGQQFVPGGRERILLPLVFCRECGQEFYSVWAHHEQSPDGTAEPLRFVPRRYAELKDEDQDEAGFLYLSTATPWPTDAEQVAERLPDDWFDDKGNVLANRRDALPRPTRVLPSGVEDQAGADCTFIPAPFRFCPSCGVAYDFRSRSDIGKLASLGTEGRSTATTMLSLNAVRALREADELNETARKLLSFTDNRQDASLQAGHFNDFVEIGVLRAALLKAVVEAGPGGLDHDELAPKVFDALSMPLTRYAANPDVRFAALEDTRKALRNVLAYRIYRDLRRGWRLMSPNLEQCGLLEIGYRSLDELCASDNVWQNRHPALAAATPAKRAEVATVLLDFMRRELAIKVDYLSQSFQEKISQQSSQYLVAPWGLDENEEMEHAAILFPRPRRGSREHVYLSARSGFGQYLRRAGTFGDGVGKLPMTDVETIIAELLECLCVGGQVVRVSEPEGNEQVPGYQVLAGAMRWLPGSGERAFSDPIRVPREPAAGRRTNPFEVVPTLVELRVAAPSMRPVLYSTPG